MPMMANHSTLYTHRRNDDGSYDSICRACFESVARSLPESKVARYEKAHECHSAFLAERGHLTERKDAAA